MCGVFFLLVEVDTRGHISEEAVWLARRLKDVAASSGRFRMRVFVSWAMQLQSVLVQRGDADVFTAGVGSSSHCWQRTLYAALISRCRCGRCGVACLVSIASNCGGAAAVVHVRVGIAGCRSHVAPAFSEGVYMYLSILYVYVCIYMHAHICMHELFHVAILPAHSFVRTTTVLRDVRLSSRRSVRLA